MQRKLRSTTRIAWLGVFTLVLVLMLGGLVFAADRLIIKDAGGIEKIVMDDSGNIKINGLVPADIPSYAKFYAADNDQVGFTFDTFISNADRGSGAIGRFARGSQSSPQAVQDGDRLGFFVFGGHDGSAFLHPAGLTARVDGTVSSGNVPAKFIFETGTGHPRHERMVIGSDGNVGIGVSDPQYLLEVGSSGAYCDGGAWVDGSSRDYKTEIKELTSNDAMAAFAELKPVTFKYKTALNDEHVGFIAEDVPVLVATAERRGMSSMDVVAVLTKVVQEQQRMIEDMQRKIKALQ